MYYRDYSVKKYAKGGEIINTIKKYKSYEDLINDNIGSKKYVITTGSGGATQPYEGANAESIGIQFKNMISHELTDGNFLYNWASDDSKYEYISLIKEFNDSLLKSPKKFADFWENNMIRTRAYDSLYRFSGENYKLILMEILKNKASNKLKQEYKEYRKSYAEEDINY
jgi:hypothetical protein